MEHRPAPFLLPPDHRFPSSLSFSSARTRAARELPEIVNRKSKIVHRAPIGAHVLDLLFSLAEENHKTLVIVTHDTQVASRGDRVLTVRDGVVCD